ncbi:MAG: hypothetical protein DID92_2727745639 [Candidatus Nitrotoga sp. SPKER]|nr:MAG: hypothetical protein DID92_2727745639 [Candidatus Nitrotoga sp. SPKER]
MKFTPKRKIDPQAVQKSLRELKMLFGDRPAKENAPLARSVGSAVRLNLKERQ